MFFRINEVSDCKDNFDKYTINMESYLKGNEYEFKWCIISLHMYLQSLFICLLRTKGYSYIKRKYKKKKEYEFTVDDSKIQELFSGKQEKEYEFIVDYKIREPFSIEQKEKGKYSINIRPDFGSKESIQALQNELKNEGFTFEEIRMCYEETQKILGSDDLYKNVKKMTVKKMTNLNFSKEENESYKQLKKMRNKFIHYNPCCWAIEKVLFIRIIKQCTELAIKLIDSSDSLNILHGEELKIDESKKKLGEIVEELTKLKSI